MSIVSHSAPAAPSTTLRQVPIDLIVPGSHQARARFDSGALDELTESIRRSGVIQPVVLRSLGRRYELLAGERRWRAAQAAGLEQVPAVIRDDLDDDAACTLGLVENLQRESLSPMETARGLRQLAEINRLTHEALGLRLGKSREYVSNFLRLLGLAPPVQSAVDDGHISLGHAKILAGLPATEQPRWATAIQAEGWSVRQFERQLAQARRPQAPVREKSADWLRLEHRLADHLAAAVRIEVGDDGRGELRVQFHSLDALDGLLQRVGLPPEN